MRAEGKGVMRHGRTIGSTRARKGVSKSYEELEVAVAEGK